MALLVSEVDNKRSPIQNRPIFLEVPLSFRSLALAQRDALRRI